jgi:hypothetical protein
MRLSHEYIDNIVPPFEPSLQAVPPFALALAERIQDRALRRSYLWANAIINVGLQNLPPRCVHFSAGFVYVSPEARENSEWSERAFEAFLFGGYVLVDETDEEANQFIYSIDVGGTRMPMVVTAGSFEPHGNPPHPHTGSGACWVQNAAKKKKWQNGILTCRHTLSNFRLGQSVSLVASASHSTPTSGSLADIDACTIDAAIVGVASNSWPLGLSPLRIHSPVPPGAQAQFAGRSSSASGTVLRIFQYSRYPGNLFGQRVIADCSGRPGDSGSLLVEASTGEGVGLYMGTIPDGSRGVDGIYQDLDQVAKYFELDLYY